MASKQSKGKRKEVATQQAPAPAVSSKSLAPAARAVPRLQPQLGQKASLASRAAAERTRTGRAALAAHDGHAESARALDSLQALDDDEDDVEAEEDEGEDDEDVQDDLADFDDEDEEGEDDDEEDEEEEDDEDGMGDSDASPDEEEEAASSKRAPAAKSASARKSAAAAASVKAASSSAAASAPSSQRRKGAASTTDDDSSPEHSATIRAPAPHPRGPRLDVEDDTIEREEFVGNLAEGSDSSADEGEDGRSVMHRNRIGNVPLEWYADYDHIGYDVSGKKIIKSAKGDKLDQLLARMDDPNWDRTIHDPVNDVSVVLTPQELDMITRLRKGQFAHGSFDPTSADYTLQTFTEDIRHEVLGQSIEPKRRFVASKWEAKTVLRYVQAMRNGWMKFPSDVEKEKAEKAKPKLSLLWGEDGNAIVDPKAFVPHRAPARITAPKAAPPTHAESYNPPREYLPTEEEIEAWERADPEERGVANFLPQAYDALRKVPAYPNLIQERFQRCLDLYLCPRAKVKKLRNIDPDSLIPNLPRPADLRPFPTTLSIEYRGHQGAINSVSLSPDGQWMASGGDDGVVRIWEVASGRCFRKWDFKNQMTETDGSIRVLSVAFNPNPALPILAVCVGSHIFLLHTHTITGGADKKAVQTMLTTPQADMAPPVAMNDKQKNILKAVTWKVLDEVVQETADGTAQEPASSLVSTESLLVKPETATPEQAAAAAAMATTGWSVLAIDCGERVEQVTWHRSGDWFASITRVSGSTSRVLIHRLSRHATQSPWSKPLGLVKAVLFHPREAFLFVMTPRSIRCWSLQTMALVKRMLSPAKDFCALSVHPTGAHLLAGSSDLKVCWYELDAGAQPKTYKYHRRAVRGVHFHPQAPLFASCSDDGNVHVFYGRVYDDLVTDPLIVPVKILKHAPMEGGAPSSATACVFHPTEPWIFSSGTDGVVRLFTC